MGKIIDFPPQYPQRPPTLSAQADREALVKMKPNCYLYLRTVQEKGMRPIIDGCRGEWEKQGYGEALATILAGAQCATMEDLRKGKDSMLARVCNNLLYGPPSENRETGGEGNT